MRDPKNALLLVDLINPFAFEEGQRLAGRASALVPTLVSLRERFRAAGAPVIYVNDNFGRWRSSFEETVEQCENGPGAALVSAIHPGPDDYFVLKPHRSGFYHCPLELLLADLEVQAIVLAGIATDMCVLATANDARMRGLQVSVVRDASQALDDTRHRRALDLMCDGMQIDVCEAAQVRPA